MLEASGPDRYTLSRRGGRVVECGGLENRYVGNPGVGGSNPPLSAFESKSARSGLTAFACQHGGFAAFSARHALRASLSAPQPGLVQAEVLTSRLEQATC